LGLVSTQLVRYLLYCGKYFLWEKVGFGVCNAGLQKSVSFFLKSNRRPSVNDGIGFVLVLSEGWVDWRGAGGTSHPSRT
jgi:hypothetical protein